MIIIHASNKTRQQLRKQLRSARRQLSAQQQHSASRQLLIHLARLPSFHNAKHIAIYWPNDGEINPLLLLKKFPRKTFYLPVLKNKSLVFKPVQKGNHFKKNRFNIPEPINRQAPKRAQQLSLILMPLVGFDRQGNRLGMGGGFYDRSCEFLLNEQKIYSTKLIGLAHHCQEVDALDNASWDVPMQSIVTDQQVIHCK